jgi:hypothetical protein
LVLAEFSRESLDRGRGRLVALDELSATVDVARARSPRSSCRVSSAGEYDENDAIVDLHAGAGGTDAQDWTEMLLRMYSRWAERRGFSVEIDEATEGRRPGCCPTFIVKGRFAYGWLAAERGVHRLVRISPFDSQPAARRASRVLDVTPFLDDTRPRWRSTRRTCASTPTAPRAPADSTSTRPTRRSASPTCRPASS